MRRKKNRYKFTRFDLKNIHLGYIIKFNLDDPSAQFA